jgi:DNA (cytosine-5)-methyltransferase 1
MSKPTVIDLFCGAGGLSKGFEMAGFNTILGIDIDKWSCLTFAYNFGNKKFRKKIVSLKNNEIEKWLNETDFKQSKIIYKDIKKIDVDELKSSIDDVDLIIGGPPCQGFSMAGRRDPNDPRNSLFMGFVKFVRTFKPKWFVMENVTGLLVSKTANGENVSEIIKQEFESIPYRVDKFILNSANYGVPQKRRRLFFIGTNTDKKIEPPFPTHDKNPKKFLKTLGIRRWTLKKQIRKWVPVRKVLFKESEVDEKYFHTQKMIDGFINRKQRNVENGRGFGWQILKMKEPSYTISARYWKDGSDALVMYSPTKVRMLTERECARIQKFPDNFQFVGPKREVYRQIGNSVPTLLAKAIGEKIKENL